jgi:uncharacterized protein YrzB (UPF0473 family)
MSEENLEQEFVEIVDEDGVSQKCAIYDVIDFEEKTYALLMPETEEGEEGEELIIMEYIEDGDDGYFQSIDDEEEFNKVCEYIENLEIEVDEEE